jgi:hypothetical protein
MLILILVKAKSLALLVKLIKLIIALRSLLREVHLVVSCWGGVVLHHCFVTTVHNIIGNRLELLRIILESVLKLVEIVGLL